MKSNGQRKTLEVFKDLFLKPGLASTYRNLFDNFPEAFDASVEVERREVVPEPSPFYDALHDDLTRTLPVELRQVIVPK